VSDRPKLSLSKETLRNLGQSALSSVYGGEDFPEVDNTYMPGFCPDGNETVIPTNCRGNPGCDTSGSTCVTCRHSSPTCQPTCVSQNGCTCGTFYCG